MNPDVSVIVPVYNTEHYIEKCLLSILAERELNIEIIIVDDASTDRSLSIINEISSADKRCKIISLPKNTPGGAGIPSNIGINAAQGDYIGFVDSDDWVEPGMFKLLYDKAKETDADYVFCDFYQFNNKTEKISASYDRHYWNEINNFPVPSDFLEISSVPWRKLIKKEYLNKHNLRFPEGDFFFEDTPFHFVITLKAQHVGYINTPLYYHRIFREEQTMYGKGQKFLAFLSHDKFILNFLLEQKLIEKYYTEFLKYVLDNFFWVWDRLNLLQRKVFFRELKSILLSVHNDFRSQFIDNEDFYNSRRLELITSGKFISYAYFMAVYKYRLGIFQRNYYFLKEKGLLEFIKKINRKFKYFINYFENSKISQKKDEVF